MAIRGPTATDSGRCSEYHGLSETLQDEVSLRKTPQNTPIPALAADAAVNMLASGSFDGLSAARICRTCQEGSWSIARPFRSEHFSGSQRACSPRSFRRLRLQPRKRPLFRSWRPHLPRGKTRWSRRSAFATHRLPTPPRAPRTSSCSSTRRPARLAPTSGRPLMPPADSSKKSAVAIVSGWPPSTSHACR